MSNYRIDKEMSKYPGSQNRMGDHYNRYQQNSFEPVNQNQFNNASINNLQPESPLSITQEPDIEYEKTTHYLTVSSRERDRLTYANVNKYRVDFPFEFKNIHSIELIQAIIPDKNDVTLEPFLLLKIDELDNVMISTDINISKSFAILQLSQPVSDAAFIYIDKRIHENVILKYKTPKASLAKMSITITDCSGTPFDFGTDTTFPTTMTNSLQNTFVFRIVTMDKKRNILSQRNVY